jgi:hypothetical protein
LDRARFFSGRAYVESARSKRKKNLNFAWCSCSNRREKHRTVFKNIVEGCFLYNFCIPFLSHSSNFWRNVRSK